MVVNGNELPSERSVLNNKKNLERGDGCEWQ
jgi:hypothetical protein